MMMMMTVAQELKNKEAKGGALALGASHNNSNFPDDLMFLILLQCPVKAIFRFKCVSRTWHRSLSASSFRDAYVSFQKELGVPQPLLGFFHFKRRRGLMIVPGNEESGPRGFSFLPSDIEGVPVAGLPFVDRVGSFRGISNGLVLCGDYPNFHVFNPITRHLFSLPRACIDIESMNRNKGFVDYQAASPGFFSSELDNDFLVIVPIVDEKIMFDGEKFVQVEMYSSKTGLWKQSKLVAGTAAGRFHVNTVLLPTSINGGTFLWFTRHGGLMVYDQHWVDDKVLLIRLPDLSSIRRPPNLCQSSDGFLQCAAESRGFSGFRVFTLAKKLDSYGREALIHSNEWIPTHNVRLEVLGAVWSHPFGLADSPQYDRYVVRMAYHPFNPLVLIFKMGSRIFSCNVENGLLNQIPHAGHHFSASELFLLLPYVQPLWPPSPLPM